MPKFPIKVPRISTIKPRMQAAPRWLNMRTGGISRMPRGLAEDRDIIHDPQEELYGPELPYDLAYARDEGRMYDYERLWAKERARQEYNRRAEEWNRFVESLMPDEFAVEDDGRYYIDQVYDWNASSDHTKAPWRR